MRATVEVKCVDGTQVVWILSECEFEQKNREVRLTGTLADLKSESERQAWLAAQSAASSR